MNQKDREALRHAAEEYREAAMQDIHAQTTEDWRRLNALRPVRPMVMIDQIPWHELNTHGDLTLRCEDGFLRSLEWGLRAAVFKWKHFPGDMTLYPYITVPKVFTNSGYGIETRVHENNSRYENAETHTYTDQLPDDDALAKLRTPCIAFDKKATAEREAYVSEILGDILPVVMSEIGRAHV